MRGTLIQRSKGSWTIILDVGRDPVTGKRKQHTETVRGAKRLPEKRLAELIHEANNGVYIKSAKATVGEFLQQWLQDYAANRVRATTLEGYRWRAKSITARLGESGWRTSVPNTFSGITPKS